MIIDAKDLIVGRLATVVAKKSLIGEKMDIVNCERAVIVGDKKNILSKYDWKRKMGDTFKGPFIHRNPERMLKRTIRGMLPYKQKKGRDAFKNIRCYLGVPEKFKDKKAETIKEAKINFKKTINYITLKEVSRHLGGKW